MTTICPGCGNPVTDPGLWLAQPEPDSPALSYCGPACGSTADQRTMSVSVRGTG